MTRLAQHLGWQGNHTDFDVLPLIFQIPGKRVTYHELPSELVKEVDIIHEHYPKLKAQFKMVCRSYYFKYELSYGGITYTCAPFNGWYMVTEIAVRNFTDSYRYNLLEKLQMLSILIH